MIHRSTLRAALLCGTLLAACRAPTPAPSATPADAALGPQLPADFEASIERTGCLGNCPVYRVVVRAGGAVDYEGRAHVKQTGRHSARLDAPDVARIAQAFEAANFFSLESPGAGGIDLPSTTLSCRGGGRQKSVLYLVAPEPIRRIETELERIAGVERWIGTAAERAALPSDMDRLLGDVLKGPPTDLERALGSPQKRPAAR